MDGMVIGCPEEVYRGNSKPEISPQVKLDLLIPSYYVLRGDKPGDVSLLII
jgi:hypothetical protein